MDKTGKTIRSAEKTKLIEKALFEMEDTNDRDAICTIVQNMVLEYVDLSRLHRYDVNRCVDSLFTDESDQLALLTVLDQHDDMQMENINQLFGLVEACDKLERLPRAVCRELICHDVYKIVVNLLISNDFGYFDDHIADMTTNAICVCIEDDNVGDATYEVLKDAIKGNQASWGGILD